MASSTAAQFDEMLQQQAALALRYADHEYGEGESVVPAIAHAAPEPMPFDGRLPDRDARESNCCTAPPGAPQAPLAVGDRAGLLQRHARRPLVARVLA